MTLTYPSTRNTDWQKFIRPMLLLSVGLHGLLLFAPMPSDRQVETVKQENTQAQVKITKLPTSDKSVAVKSAQTAVKPSPATRQLVRQDNALVIPQKSLVKPAKPATSTAKQQATKPISKTTPERLPAPTQAANTASNLQDPFLDFPKYQNTQPGSLGLFSGELDRSSQQVQAPITEVSQFFERELRAREYKVELAKDAADTKVFQVTKGDTVKFLNLFVRSNSTVIVLASEILTPENIANATNISPEEEAFVSVLDGIETESVAQPDLYLANPSLFYTKFSEGKDGYYEVEQKPNTLGTIRLIADRVPQQVFDTTFATNLKSSGFDVTLQGQYGGGAVYEVKQGTFVTYLNLVPTADGSGTVIVSWSSPPS